MATKMIVNEAIKATNVDLAIGIGTAKSTENFYLLMAPQNLTKDETYESLKDSHLYVVFNKGTYPIKTYKQYPDGSYKFQVDQRFEYKMMIPQRNDTTYEIPQNSPNLLSSSKKTNPATQKQQPRIHSPGLIKYKTTFKKGKENPL